MAYIGLHTLTILRKSGDKSAEKAVRSWMALANYQDPQRGLVVRCWTTKEYKFEVGIVQI
jgi:hypothetical protein